MEVRLKSGYACSVPIPCISRIQCRNFMVRQPVALSAILEEAVAVSGIPPLVEFAGCQAGRLESRLWRHSLSVRYFVIRCSSFTLQDLFAMRHYRKPPTTPGSRLFTLALLASCVPIAGDRVLADAP